MSMSEYEIIAFGKKMFEIAKPYNISILNWVMPDDSDRHESLLKSACFMQQPNNPIENLLIDYEANLKMTTDLDFGEDLVSIDTYNFLFCHMYAVALWMCLHNGVLDLPTVFADGQGDIGANWEHGDGVYGGTISVMHESKSMAWFQGQSSKNGDAFTHYRSKGVVPQELIAAQIAMLCHARETVVSPVK